MEPLTAAVGEKEATNKEKKTCINIEIMSAIHVTAMAASPKTRCFFQVLPCLSPSLCLALVLCVAVCVGVASPPVSPGSDYCAHLSAISSSLLPLCTPASHQSISLQCLHPGSPTAHPQIVVSTRWYAHIKASANC